jgi:hypothetical protein
MLFSGLGHMNTAPLNGMLAGPPLTPRLGPVPSLIIFSQAVTLLTLAGVLVTSAIA